MYETEQEKKDAVSSLFNRLLRDGRGWTYQEVADWLNVSLTPEVEVSRQNVWMWYHKTSLPQAAKFVLIIALGHRHSRQVGFATKVLEILQPAPEAEYA